jgi:integrase
MPRRPTAQIVRDRRVDGSVTFALRVRAGGHDARVPLGNSDDGWDEIRAERARRELHAKLELGLWTPQPKHAFVDATAEPTFRELATDWFEDRQRNPEVREATVSNDLWALTRYLLPFFGDLLPSQIGVQTVKAYRRQIHDENATIRTAAEAGSPLIDPRTRQPLRVLGNDSINKTLRTLAAVLDEAEDHGWVARNVARGRRAREPVQRRRGEILQPAEFLSLLEAASVLDHQRHSARTLERADEIRDLRDKQRLAWNEVVARTRIPIGTVFYLYRCRTRHDMLEGGPRRAIIATLGLSGLRVGELCKLDVQHLDLAGGRIHVREAKTRAGVRIVDIVRRLRDELDAYLSSLDAAGPTAPAFPTRTGGRRDRQSVNAVVHTVVRRANEIRLQHGNAPILANVTPHTLRRTFISFLLAAGYDVPYVQAQVGHDDPTTTLGVYARVIREPDRDRIRIELGALLHGAGDTAPPIDAVQPGLF